jgi:putative redox protein
MKAVARWVQDAMFVGESGSGHAVVMDGAPEAGGRNLGARPMEMVLLGLAGCTGFDVVQILKKARQPISGCVVEVSAQRADAPPRVFTRIHVHYRVSGAALAEHHVQRAVSLSVEKYCSVSVMLGRGAEITHDFEITAAG